MSTQLRIVKRNKMYVVQIRQQRFFTRRWYWIDMGSYLVKNQRLLITKNGSPLPETSFNTKDMAERYCLEFLKKERGRNKDDIMIMTFNTCLHDRVWPKPPPTPKHNPPKKPSEIDLLELGGTGTGCKPPRGSIKYTDGSDVFPEDDNKTNM